MLVVNAMLITFGEREREKKKIVYLQQNVTSMRHLARTKFISNTETRLLNIAQY